MLTNKNMKKINYIIGFAISFLVLYQPIQQDIENFLNEKKRVKYENYVNSFLTRDTVSFKQSKKQSRLFNASGKRLPINKIIL